MWTPRTGLSARTLARFEASICFAVINADLPYSCVRYQAIVNARILDSKIHVVSYMSNNSHRSPQWPTTALILPSSEMSASNQNDGPLGCPSVMVKHEVQEDEAVEDSSTTEALCANNIDDTTGFELLPHERQEGASTGPSTS